MSATALQPEPSAKAPCTRTTFLICSFMIILLFPLVSFRSSHQTCRCCPENPTATHNAVRLPPLASHSSPAFAHLYHARPGRNVKIACPPKPWKSRHRRQTHLPPLCGLS